MGEITPLRRMPEDDGQRRAQGRPSEYDPSFCEFAEEVLSRGPAYSLVSVAAGLDVSPQTLHRWKNEHAEFRDAIQRGRVKGMFIGEHLLDGMMRSPLTTTAQLNSLRLGLLNRTRALEALRDEWLTPKEDPNAGEAAEAEPDLSALSEDELAQLHRLTTKLAGQPEGADRD